MVFSKAEGTEERARPSRAVLTMPGLTEVLMLLLPSHEALKGFQNLPKASKEATFEPRTICFK